MPWDLFKGFWGYLGQSNFLWWQTLIIIFVIIVSLMIGKFWQDIIIWIGERFTGQNTVTLQYRMFWGLSNDVINMRMKDEFRRSLKENGFDILSGNDFSNYVKNQSKLLMSILRNYIINLYPPNKNIKITMEDILEYIDKKESAIEDTIFEIYIEAKRIKKQDTEQYDLFDKKFEQEIEKFIKSKKDNLDCKNCLIILFGKREIVENKKSKIKTLKSQMNFVEQKLSEIHSDLLSFYSEKINTIK